MEPGENKTSVERHEDIIHVPWDVLDACNGLAFDIGGSVIKAVYIHKDDWREPSDRTTERGPLRLVNFSREDIAEALPYVKQRTYIRRDTPDVLPLVYTTGIGGAAFLLDIREAFNVETKNLSEMDCFVAAHRFMLEHQTQADLVHETSEKAIKAVEKHVATYSAIVDNVQKSDTPQTGMPFIEKREFELSLKNKPDAEKTFIESGDVFPNALVMCGSAGCLMKVDENGTFLTVEMMYRCGRMFLGLGCMLTGAETYDELMALAEKGDAGKIHQNWEDVTKDIPKEDDSIYSTFTSDVTEDMDEMFVFLYGKAVGKSKDKFKPEDTAKALVISAANDLAQTTSLVIANPEVSSSKHIFFCGNYIAHPLMRQFVTMEWGQRDAMQAMFRGKEMKNVHFLKYGAHYGALGCLLNYKLKFTDKMAEMSEKAAETFKEELGLTGEKKED